MIEILFAIITVCSNQFNDEYINRCVSHNIECIFVEHKQLDACTDFWEM